ncbi:unnamed protein product [Caenorhabditis angaria]|uniref:Hexosyltransferase n=1 Tax=Caenorhabditis angaria TaxID=860376 RepID=A0A9P1IJ40_9PELO|nr:unnamed protein product [Caenorhabditis angaria]
MLKRAEAQHSTQKTFKKESPYRFDYYEQLLATPPMRISSKKTNITNRIIYAFIIFASITLLLWNQSAPLLTESERQCILDETYPRGNISSADLGESFRIAFYDVQKTFKILQLPNVSCDFAEHSTSTTVLMMIQTRAKSFTRRNVLRETVISAKNSKIVEDGNMKFIFVTGQNEEDEKVNEILENESRLYGDLLITDMHDNYTNLPFKALQSILFASSRCKNVDLIGKIDEDVIFYPDQLAKLLPGLRIEADTNLILGDLWREGVMVNHEPDTKWYIPKEAYRCNRFPQYAAGPLYFMTRQAAKDILKVSNGRKFITVEDSLITGLYSVDINAENIHLPMMYYHHGQTTDLSRRQLLSWHNKKNDEQFRMSFFYMLSTRCLPCKKF